METTLDAKDRGSTVPGELLDLRLVLVVTTASGVSSVEVADGGALTIGRGAEADISLPDPSLSRAHARLERVGDRLRVIDLGSRNGTWIAGQRITEAEVPVAGAFSLGSVSIQVQLAQPARAVALGLASSTVMLATLQRECERSQRFGRPLAIALLRSARGRRGWLLDRKLRGHAALRPSDSIGVLDREAVILVMPETTGAEARAIVLGLLGETLGADELVGGVAAMPEHATSAAELVSRALRALQQPSVADPVRVAPGRPTLAAAPRQAALRVGAMQELERIVARLAPKQISVLILGETGAGKELVARELHAQGPRSSRPLQVVNCAAIPNQLVESVLFGHVRGAFTGAHRDHDGVFVEASGGSVFLDEVGELSAAAQAALLRVLDDRRVRPVGGKRELEVDVRVIAATHRNLAAMVEAGTFRLDLYHRLSAVVLRVPPLRERRDEIIPLAEHFLARFREEGCATQLSRETEAALLAYDWPGNVRELRNVIERAVALATEATVQPSDLPEHVERPQPESSLAPAAQPAPAAVSLPPSAAPEPALDLRDGLRQHERLLIEEALRRSDGNQRRAASLLRVPLRTLERKLSGLGIRRPR